MKSKNVGTEELMEQSFIPAGLSILRGRSVRRYERIRPPMSKGVCPPWLDELAQECWQAYGPVLIEMGVLSVVDEPQFAMIRERWSVYRRAAADLQTSLVSEDRFGQAKPNPAADVAHTALSD